MASCERCWNDAFMRSLEGPDNQAEAYRKLLMERTGPLTCTPEQQAGEDAGWCPDCCRRTWHQVAGVCTVDSRHGQLPRSPTPGAQAEQPSGEEPHNG